MFDKATVVCSEGGGGMAVDVELTHRNTIHENRRDNLRFGFERARQVAGIGVDVVDNNRLRGGEGSASDSFVQGNAFVRCLSTHVWA